MLRRTITLSLFYTVLCFSTTAHPVTLDEAVRNALLTNPDVLITTNERLARDQALKQARGNYLPTLDLIAGAGRERTDDASTRARGEDDISLTRREIELRANQLLFDGFATKFETERQRARVESGAHRVLEASERTALRAVEAYLEVLRRQDLLRLSQENLKAHTSIYDQIQSRAGAGVGRKSDLDQIESRLALARANVVADEFNLSDAETDYLRVINEMPADLLRPVAPTEALPASMEEAVDLAVANHPTLKVADADIEATEAQHGAARNGYYPQFDLEAAARAGEDLDGIEGADDELSILLRARWNLFRGFRDRARLRETAALTEEAREVRNRAHRQVVQSVRLSWVAHEAARNVLGLLQQRVVSAEKTRNAYKQQFNIGKRTLLDLLDTENEVTDAQVAYLNADMDGLFAQYRILLGTGQLLETLNIPAPREADVDGDQTEAPDQATSSVHKTESWVARTDSHFRTNLP